MTEKLTIKTIRSATPPKTFSGGVVVCFAAAGEKLFGVGAQLFEKTGLSWERQTKAADFSGKKKQVMSMLAPPDLECDRLLVLGTGPALADSGEQDAEGQGAGPEKREEAEKTADGPDAGAPDWAGWGGVLYGIIRKTGTQKALVCLDSPSITPQIAAQIVAGMHLRHYSFDKYKSVSGDEEGREEADKPLAVSLLVNDKTATDKHVKRAMARVQGTLLARDLQNEPPNVLGPVEFAKIARSLTLDGVDVEIYTPAELKSLGMNAMLSVAQGSARPARLVVMRWEGGKKDQAPIAFVGKGVVFDTGGISIKPAASMQDMKGDMGGAAAVTGLMNSLALRKARVNAIGVIGLVENMPGGNAYRPGDIIRAMSGTTIEVINTDAEGRLVLADALWYTQDRFKPKFMIDLATLTGAIMVALGQDHAGLFSNDDELAGRLAAAGAQTGEKLWRMPLGKAYDKMIKSRFADIKNTGGRYGGAITAAQFLARFVNDVPWAHLDIAGTGFSSPSTDTNKSWASGFGVAVLDQLVSDHYED